MQTLASFGVPTYIFSSGYGDIVAQAMIQSGGIDGGGIPQNIRWSWMPFYVFCGSFENRIISNFFRATPDGTVRGFSQPVIHDKLVLCSAVNLCLLACL